jgi:hypothetical protein
MHAAFLKKDCNQQEQTTTVVRGGFIIFACCAVALIKECWTSVWRLLQAVVESPHAATPRSGFLKPLFVE